MLFTYDDGFAFAGGGGVIDFGAGGDGGGSTVHDTEWRRIVPILKGRIRNA